MTLPAPEVIVWARIAAHAPLAALIDGAWTDRFPPDYTLGAKPAVLVRPPISDTNEAGFSSAPWRRANVRVHVYVRDAQSQAALRQAASIISGLFDRAAFVIQGVQCSALASGPVDSPVDDPGQAGRMVQIDLRAAEAAQQET